MKLLAIKKYWHFWTMLARNELQTSFVNRYTNLLFLVGKLIRFGMGVLFLILIKNNTRMLGGYTSDQAIVFFLTYQFVDTIVQAIYRGAYNFGHQVRTGEFDLTLSQPINSLFRALLGKPDFNDVAFIIPTTVISVWLMANLNIEITFINFLIYLILLINSFIIATSLHILALSVGILTTEVDNLMWIYRDISRMGQFPVNIYGQLLKLALFFLVPIGFMYTVPAQVLLGTKPEYLLAIAFIISASFLTFSIVIWRWSLKRYSSVGS